MDFGPLEPLKQVRLFGGFTSKSIFVFTWQTDLMYIFREVPTRCSSASLTFFVVIHDITSVV